MTFTRTKPNQYKVTRDAVGSNQYVRVIKKRRHPRLRSFASIALISGVLFTAFVIPFYNDNKLKPAYAPTLGKAYAFTAPTVTPVPSEKDEIREYVKEVFGKDSDKAFKLLSCENHALNPKAVNKAGNFPVDSEDRGLFQINSYWQKIDNKAFLFDYKINTMIAYNIFKRDGNSFKLWSCGRRLSI